MPRLPRWPCRRPAPSPAHAVRALQAGRAFVPPRDSCNVLCQRPLPAPALRTPPGARVGTAAAVPGRMLCTAPVPGEEEGCLGESDSTGTAAPPRVPSPQGHPRQLSVAPGDRGFPGDAVEQNTRSPFLGALNPGEGRCQAELAQPHLCSGRIFGLCADFAICFYLAAGFAFNAQDSHLPPCPGPVSALGLGPPIQHPPAPGQRRGRRALSPKALGKRRSPQLPVLPGTPRAAMHPAQWIAAWALLLGGTSGLGSGVGSPGGATRPGAPWEGDVGAVGTTALGEARRGVCPQGGRAVLLLRPRCRRVRGWAAERG